MLLIGFVCGIFFLIVWCILFFSPIMFMSTDYDIYSFFTMYKEQFPYEIDEILNLPMSEKLHSIVLFFVPLFYIIVSFISLITAIILNLLGWKFNDIKKIFFAATLYIISLNIPSVIICFFHFAKNKNLLQHGKNN